MNYIELMGGLGNQLFEYTFGRYCEQVTGNDSLFYTNFFDYIKDTDDATVREYKLPVIKGDFVAVKGTITCSRIVEERNYEGLENAQDNTFFRGYWQRKGFFEAMESAIREEICLKDEYISEELQKEADEIKNGNSVALHIRHGDYLNEANRKLFAQLDTSYYKKAMTLISEKYSEGLTAYIFTDDKEGVSDMLGMFGNMKVKLMPAREDYEDMYLMSNARHHVIANSSFSWWGAALSDHIDGITVAPKDWYVGRPSPDLYLADWIVV